MKIRIYTEREFPESKWDEYVRSMKSTGSSITDEQYSQLFTTGKLVIDYDQVTLIYEITERG